MKKTIWPKIDKVYENEYRTNVRVKCEGIYYLSPVVGSHINQVNEEALLVFLFGKVNPELTFANGEKIFQIDEDQRDFYDQNPIYFPLGQKPKPTLEL